MILFRYIIIILAVHISSLFIIQTSYVPDEYWQSLEVAHKMVFHYGNVTWEWEEGIRSYLYPSLIAALYYIMQFYHMDTVRNLILFPRLCQTVMSAVSDIYFCSWLSSVNPEFTYQAVLSICTSWFWLYCASRTLTNTVEASLSVIALYYFPWNSKESDGSSLFLFLVGFAGMIRPTAIIPWFPLCLYHILSSHSRIAIIRKYLCIGILCLFISSSVDCNFYGYFVCSPLNFVYLNVVKKLSDFYGTHPVHWYVTVGLPVVLGLHIIPFLLGCKRCFLTFNDTPTKIIKLLSTSILFTVGIHSFLPHKEFRFILSILHMCLFISTSWLVEFYSRCRRSIIVLTTAAFLLASVIPCMYMGLFHQRGSLDVMGELAHDAAANPHQTNILFLMPCHSTPLYSHLHVNVTTRFLTCDPRQLFVHKLPRDEADEFFLSPHTWLSENFQDPFPSHVVLFDILYPQVSDFFAARNYKIFQCFHHAHFTEGNVGQYVYILRP